MGHRQPANCPTEEATSTSLTKDTAKMGRQLSRTTSEGCHRPAALQSSRPSRMATIQMDSKTLMNLVGPTQE